MSGKKTESLMFSRHDKPFGKSWEEWTTRWWRWLLSIPKSDSPALDETGAKFYPDKQDKSDVIFLAGNLGGSSNRKYIISADRALLFPIINFTTSYKEEPDLKTEEDLDLRAKSDIDDIVKKNAVIDGKLVENISDYRVHAPPFDISFPPNNILDLDPGLTRSVSDGYWIFLKPLPVGFHEIHTVGACSSGKTRVDCTFHLEIEK